MTSRAASSTDSAVTPGRACSQAASWASCSTAKYVAELARAARRGRTSGCSPSSSPRRWCRRCRRPRRRRASITRSPTSWCGEAPLGPEPTMTKSTVACPSSRIAAAISRPASRSVMPGAQELGHPGVHAVDRLAGPAQGVDLVGRLAHPQVSEDRRGEALLRARQGGAEPQHLLGPHPVGQRRPEPTPADAGGDERVRVLGLAPAQHLDAQPRHAGRLHRRHLEAGRDEERLARRRAGPGRSGAPAGARRSRSASAGPGPE